MVYKNSAGAGRFLFMFREFYGRGYFYSKCILVPFRGRALFKIKENTQIEKDEICGFKNK